MKSQKNVKSSCYNTHQGQTQDVKQQNVPLSGPNDTTRRAEAKRANVDASSKAAPPARSRRAAVGRFPQHKRQIKKRRRSVMMSPGEERHSSASRCAQCVWGECETQTEVCITLNILFSVYISALFSCPEQLMM